MVLATFTRSPMLRKRIITIMKAAVAMTPTCGVPNRLETFWKAAGSRPSRLIASGLREAARMPLLPVVTNARIAAADSRITPPRPRNVPAASLSGVR